MASVGVLVRWVQTSEGWKIAQYHLSFPIPNDKAKRITSLIMQ